MKKLLQLLLLTSIFFSCAQPASNDNEEATMVQVPEGQPIAIVIHGGAGTIKKENMDPEQEKEITEILEKALQTGYNILEEGGTSLDAVEATIQVMEQSRYFNAGIGAVFTSEGTNELDASIMEGSTNAAGAVAGVSRIKSPISGARAVMEKSPHVMMVGDGAEKFAEQIGLEMVSPDYFFDQSRFDALKRVQEREKEQEDNRQGALDPFEADSKFGTVGCVALDRNGNIAAGTSTGGMTNKKYGRVGDAPIIGAGTYANNETCGVSATGHGEYFIRNVVAYDIAALMKYKALTVDQAANQIVMEKLVEIGGAGGVIAMDRRGNITMPFNTPGMYRGYLKENQEPVVQMYKED